MTEYGDKLKDPRWQRKRLEILQRDNFTCERCKSTTKTLNVHHVAYINNYQPWDYPSFYYMTLCDECHQKEHTEREELEKQLIETMRSCHIFSEEINDLIDIIIYISAFREHPIVKVIHMSLCSAVMREKGYENLKAILSQYEKNKAA